jgi:signal peptidase I
MSPTVLLADPSVRLAGVRMRGPARQGRRRRTVRFRWIAAAWLAAVVVCGLAFLQTWPPLATVMSGSMAPTIDTGDVVLLKRLERPARIGDIVSIPVPDEARARFGYPPVVIHRIVAIDAAGSVTTKGYARKEPDPFSVPARALTTRVVATVPAAGRALAFLGSPLGLLWLVGGGVMLIGMPLLERSRDHRRRGAEEQDNLQRALATLTAELVALREERTHEAVRAADAAERERLAAEAHQQALAESAERERVAAAARQAALAEAAERERLAAEAHQQALAEAAERERLTAEALQRALAEAARREELAAEAHQRALAGAAEREQRLAAEATEARVTLARHLEELPALLERAIADAFASAPAPPPPPPPAAPGRFVAASAFRPTPDLLGCLAQRPAAPDLFAATTPAWDAPPESHVLMQT